MATQKLSTFVTAQLKILSWSQQGKNTELFNLSNKVEARCTSLVTHPRIAKCDKC